MSILHLSGESRNIILSASSFASSSSEDSNLPWSNLTNPQGWYAGRFSAAAANDFIHADLGSSMAATFCMVFFHNIDDGITVELRSGASGSTLVDTMTQADPAFFSTFNSASNQHWRLTFSGTNSSPIYVGKWVLGTHQTLTPVQQYGWSIEERMSQIRSGVMSPSNLSTFANRELSMEFMPSKSERDEILTMVQDSKYGAEPLVIVPSSTEPEVLYGRAPGSIAWRRDTGDIYPMSMTVPEDAMPVIVT